VVIHGPKAENLTECVIPQRLHLTLPGVRRFRFQPPGWTEGEWKQNRRYLSEYKTEALTRFNSFQSVNNLIPDERIHHNPLVPQAQQNQGRRGRGRTRSIGVFPQPQLNGNQSRTKLGRRNTTLLDGVCRCRLRVPTTRNPMRVNP
jgi:hypothetical protein